MAYSAHWMPVFDAGNILWVYIVFSRSIERFGTREVIFKMLYWQKCKTKFNESQSARPEYGLREALYYVCQNYQNSMITEIAIPKTKVVSRLLAVIFKGGGGFESLGRSLINLLSIKI